MFSFLSRNTSFHRIWQLWQFPVNLIYAPMLLYIFYSIHILCVIGVYSKSIIWFDKISHQIFFRFLYMAEEPEILGQLKNFNNYHCANYMFYLFKTRRMIWSFVNYVTLHCLFTTSVVSCKACFDALPWQPWHSFHEIVARRQHTCQTPSQSANVRPITASSM